MMLGDGQVRKQEHKCDQWHGVAGIFSLWATPESTINNQSICRSASERGSPQLRPASYLGRTGNDRAQMPTTGHALFAIFQSSNSPIRAR